MTRFVLLLPFLIGPLLACETDLGRVCDEDPELIAALFEVDPEIAGDATENVIVSDVRFDACASTLCMQQAGGEPFCTRRCTTDGDCSDEPGFICARAIAFGREGCGDFRTNPDCIDDDGTASDEPIRHCVRGP